MRDRGGRCEGGSERGGVGEGGDSDTDFWIRLVGEEEDDPVARKRVKVAASGGQDAKEGIN